MALTMSDSYVEGHSVLAQLLEPVCTDPRVLSALAEVAGDPALAGYAAEEFVHGLKHAASGELERAVGPLTIGLEGLLRRSAVVLQLLTQEEVRRSEAGSRLVKALWPQPTSYHWELDSSDPRRDTCEQQSGSYEPYMRSWVFGMADVYRHGDDHGTAHEQALHALCGAAIWADRIMSAPIAFEMIRAGLDQQITCQFSAGLLTLQPGAERRLQRAAGVAGKTGTVTRLLELREQLLEMRHHRTPATGTPPA